MRKKDAVDSAILFYISFKDGEARAEGAWIRLITLNSRQSIAPPHASHPNSSILYNRMLQTCMGLISTPDSES